MLKYRLILSFACLFAITISSLANAMDNNNAPEEVSVGATVAKKDPSLVSLEEELAKLQLQAKVEEEKLRIAQLQQQQSAITTAPVGAGVEENPVPVVTAPVVVAPEVASSESAASVQSHLVLGSDVTNAEKKVKKAGKKAKKKWKKHGPKF